MKVGLPRAIMYHYYYPMWRGLFERLNIPVIISDKTSKTLVQPGINATVPEICLPIKIFNAHVIDLLNKGADYIFIPRFVSIEKNYWFCPKYIGLPELVESTFPNINLLAPDINCKREDTCETSAYLPLCEKLGVTKQQMKAAIKGAAEDFKTFRVLNQQGFTIDETDKIMYDNIPKEKFKQEKQDVVIGLLGYVYNIYDPFISMGVIDKMRDMGVSVVTFDMLSSEQLTKYRNKREKEIYWTFTDKLYQSAHVMLEDFNADGLIHVTAFGCGPDSIIGKKIEHDFAHFNKPFMTLRVDEHTGENHLQTRIEAFIDMIKRSKARVS